MFNYLASCNFISFPFVFVFFFTKFCSMLHLDTTLFDWVDETGRAEWDNIKSQLTKTLEWLKKKKKKKKKRNSSQLHLECESDGSTRCIRTELSGMFRKSMPPPPPALPLPCRPHPPVDWFHSQATARSTNQINKLRRHFIELCNPIVCPQNFIRSLSSCGFWFISIVVVDRKRAIATGWPIKDDIKVL